MTRQGYYQLRSKPGLLRMDMRSSEQRCRPVSRPRRTTVLSSEDGQDQRCMSLEDNGDLLDQCKLPRANFEHDWPCTCKSWRMETQQKIPNFRDNLCMSTPLLPRMCYFGKSHRRPPKRHLVRLNICPQDNLSTQTPKRLLEYCYTCPLGSPNNDLPNKKQNTIRGTYRDSLCKHGRGRGPRRKRNVQSSFPC